MQSRTYLTDPNARGIWFSSTMSFRTWCEIVRLLVQRDLRVRYRGSVLGYLWSMLNPLLYMSVLSLVFSQVMRFRVEAFPLFLLSGILVWNLFQQGMSIGVNSIVNNGPLLRKVKVPTSLFPASSVGSVLVNFVLALLPYSLISAVIGRFVGLELMALPILLLPYLMFVFGLVMIVAALNVRYRDVAHVLDPVLTIVFYATPIIYPTDAIPERFRSWLNLNPMTHFVAGLRGLLFEGHLPSAGLFALLCLFGVISLGTGLLVHRKLNGSFIFYL